MDCTALVRFGLLVSLTALISACSTPSSSSTSSYSSAYATQYTAPPVSAGGDYAPAAVEMAEPSVADGNGSGAWEAPAIYAESAILIDARSGAVLFAKSADLPRPVASTQKLLTALVLLERGLGGSLVVHPDDTAVEPTKLGVHAGETYPRETLLGAMMVKSCNDCAAALARDHAGSVYAFAVEMNRKAYALGARNSHFLNPHGLPEPGQYSTARDMARIAFAAYRSSTLRKYMRSRFYQVQLASGRVRTLEATNKLLSRSGVYNGMKTGYTNASGRCLVSSASSGGREVILVQLGSKTKYIFDDAERMMQWGLQRRSGAAMFAAN